MARRPKLRIAATLIGLLWLGVAFPAKKQWIEVTSDHFIVRSDSARETVLALVQDLERFRSVMETLAGVDLSNDPTPPLMIYVFTTLSDYQKNLRAYGTLGFYMNPTTGGRAFLFAEDITLRGIESRQTLFHEYTHHILHQFSAYRYPVWYDEGFAEYVSTIIFQEEEGKVLLGDVEKVRGSVLESYPWIPCGELIGAHGQYAAGSRSGISNTGMQYAQGWLLTHYLNTHREMGSKLDRFIRQANATPEQAMDVFQEIFGLDSIACNKTLKDYWDNRKLKYVMLPMPEVVMNVRVRRMEEEEARAQIMEARILSRQYKGTLPKLHKAFTRALEAQVRPNDMLRYLVAVALFRRDYAKADALSARLVEAYPDDAKGLAARAAVLLGGARDDKHFPTDLAVIKQAIALYRRAMEADPSEASAYVGFANAHLAPQIDATPEALAAIEAAARLNADAVVIRAIHARLLARLGDEAGAKQILRSMALWARSDGRRQAYEKDLRRVPEADWPAPVRAALVLP